MAITSITIENFKGIGDAVTVPIRPITLLFGKNSAGKSTVLQALRYFRKIHNTEVEPGELGGSGDGSGRDSGDGFGDGFGSSSARGDGYGGGFAQDVGDGNKEIYPERYTILGDFHSLVHRQEFDREIRIRLEFDINPEHLKRTKSKSAWIKIITGWDEEQQITTEELEFGPDEHRLLMDSKEKSEIKNIMLRELQDLRHLGPVRDVLPRNHDSMDSMPESAVSRWASRWTIGLEAWDALERDSKLVEKTNRYMKKLALGYTFKRSEDRKHKIQLYDETHKIYLHPLDVGFGISQVIPVVVGALESSCQLFAVEQPELHLHPAAQIALGDLFIDVIKNTNRTMLIETHSEHLLLRIMRRMRETFEDRIEENRFPVTPDDIAVLFVEWHDSQTIIREMPVNERGELVKAWPGGFFEEDIEEVFA